MQVGDKFKVGDKVRFVQKLFGNVNVLITCKVVGVVRLSTTCYQVVSDAGSIYIVDEDDLIRN